MVKIKVEMREGVFTRRPVISYLSMGKLKDKMLIYVNILWHSEVFLLALWFLSWILYHKYMISIDCYQDFGPVRSF